MFWLRSLIFQIFISGIISSVILPHNNWCNLHDIFNGNWSYGDIIHVKSLPYSSCPQLLKSLSSTTLKDQPEKWSCLNSSYYSATYTPFDCHIRPLFQSLKLLSGKHLTFIGDSLMGEIYIALSCALEKYGLHNSIKLQYIHELFLRPDIPCDPQCLTNQTYREEQKQLGLVNSCFQCKDGIKIYFNQSYLHNPKYWPTKVKLSNTTSVLISVGAWFNFYHLKYEPIQLYQQTIQRNIPIFHSLKHHGILFYWLDVPPMPICDHPWCQFFGWEQFEKFNSIARELLEPVGVIFLNTSQITKQRKDYDRNISDIFSLHWCNPGPDTMPEMINQWYLHLLSHHLGL